MKESFNYSESLNKRTQEAQQKLEKGGTGAREAHFELQKLTEEADNVRFEAEQENKKLDKEKQGVLDENHEKQVNFFEKSTPVFINPIDQKKEGKGFMNKSQDEYIKYIKEKYADDYVFPGEEYYKYLNLLSSDKVPQEFKTREIYYQFIGSLDEKSIKIPELIWDGDNFSEQHGGSWLENDMHHRTRIVCFNK